MSPRKTSATKSVRRQRRLWTFVAIACFALVSSAFAFDTVDSILDANRDASGGAAWEQQATLDVEYAYKGQGLTGRKWSLTDLKHGFFVDRYVIDPISGGAGFDGQTAWLKDRSGGVSPQTGGDSRKLAVNEAFRRANMWWRKGRGGAFIEFASSKREDGHAFDVLSVVPRNGAPFEAWFDATSHLLARVVERQMYFTITTDYEDYRRVSGAMVAYRIVVDTGNPANRQTKEIEKISFKSCEPISTFSPPPFSPTDFSIDGNAPQTTIPFELINNHIYINVMVNGQGPFHFVFDTGGHDILFPQAARKLGIPMLGSLQSGGSGDKEVDTGYAKVREFAIGSAKLVDQVVMVLVTMPPDVEGVRVDGLIGYEVFRRFITRIDYGSKQITLIDPRRANPRVEGVQVPLLFDGQMPQVRGAFEGRPGTFNIDTGSRSEIDMTEPFVTRERIRESHPNGVEAITGWGVGGPTLSYVTRGKSLALGSVVVSDVVANLSTARKGVMSDPTIEGNVGSGLLKRFAVTFDYQRETMTLEKLPGQVPDVSVFDRSGMWINSHPKAMWFLDSRQRALQKPPA